jgi:hypothetical protein
MRLLRCAVWCALCPPLMRAPVHSVSPTSPYLCAWRYTICCLPISVPVHMCSLHDAALQVCEAHFARRDDDTVARDRAPGAARRRRPLAGRPGETASGLSASSYTHAISRSCSIEADTLISSTAGRDCCNSRGFDPKTTQVIPTEHLEDAQAMREVKPVRGLAAR